MTQTSSDFRFVTFGEAMIRIAPLTAADYFSTNNRPSGASNTFLTVGGDELNVAVALSKLNIPSEWISVLPTGPIGHIISQTSTLAKVNLDNVIYVDGSDAGIFFVLPEEKRVHYQRQNSAWANQKKNQFDWPAIFSKYDKNKVWLHITGITPMTGDIPAENWQKGIDEAHRLNIPITMDFNHRKQLGPLQKLWDLTKPNLKKLDLLILSHDSIQGLVKLENIPESQSPREMLLALHKKLGVRLVYCDKYRQNKIVDGKEQEVQTRFSVFADQQELHTTEDIPVLHIPKDECGGGSAWAAGYISSRMETKSSGKDIPQWRKSLRRADLLAALCQETTGDHSTVTQAELLTVETYFNNAIADISSTSTVPQILSTANRYKLESVVAGLKASKVVPILRAKNSPLAIQRAIELIELGCSAIEVTLDTPNTIHVLKEIRRLSEISGKKCMIGVGTVLNKSQIQTIVGLVDFAISPVNPAGFIDECHKYNILAIPGASSPQELWNTKLEGAKVVKLFPSQLWSTAALKEVLNVGPLGELNVMATGGITPEKFPEWLAAGAAVVGMGSRLCGNDIKYLEGDPEFLKEHENWKTSGHKAAATLFQGLKHIK